MMMMIMMIMMENVGQYPLKSDQLFLKKLFKLDIDDFLHKVKAKLSIFLEIKKVPLLF